MQFFNPSIRTRLFRKQFKQKTLNGPKYIDVDILNSMLEADTNKKNSSLAELSDEELDDVNYDVTNNIDVEDETEFDISESIENVNPELLRKYNLDYIKYQYKLYSEIFGIDALESENLEQFKDTMADFETKRLSILRIYLFAKSCSMSKKMEKIY